MKLYTLPNSPNSRKVRAVMNHLKLEAELQVLDFARGEMRTSAFMAVNPNAMVPVLVDGPLTLWESNAITQYLADKTGGNALFPTDLVKRADVTRWQFWEQAHFNRAFGTLVFEGLIKPKFGMGEPSPGLMEFCLGELGRFAPVLDSHLQGRDTLVGDDITIADYSMMCLEAYRGATAFDWSPFANINRYFDRMRQVDHWVKSAPAPQPVQAAA